MPSHRGLGKSQYYDQAGGREYRFAFKRSHPDVFSDEGGDDLKRKVVLPTLNGWLESHLEVQEEKSDARPDLPEPG